ncbi:hypothetical protein GGR36_004344 [Niveibacterium umoris]|uniref:Uncharacterized protein n=1 Tax=Niveibacterium umoris TaxID=1193620 RepID=A0A840BW06_9RHOO|nr:hypothetical protein [Niveibacterium umoris]
MGSMALSAPYSVTPNKSVNGTPKCCAFWFPSLRSGARYVQRYAY